MNGHRAFIAIDPGVITGLAWTCGGFSRLHKDLFTEGNRGDVLERGHKNMDRDEEVVVADGIVDLVHALQIKFGRVTVLVEDFTLRRFGMDKNLLAPVRMASYLRALLRPEPMLEWHWRESSARNVITDARLRQWGLWVPGSAHKRDAVRHLAAWLRS